MAKLRSAARWLTDEWPVPRWICLIFAIGAVTDLIAR